jgi:hypothetical protein
MFVRPLSVTRKVTHTPAERRLIDSIAKGDVADFSSIDPSENDPSTGVSWGAHRTLGAEVVRAMAIGVTEASSVRSAELRIAGARISGTLNLSRAEIPIPIAFIGCYFEREISLRDASATSIFLGGSTVPSLDARSLRTSSDLQICDGFRSHGIVRLESASIEGNLSFNGAVLNSGAGDIALLADGATVGRNLLMSNGFHASGEVSLRRTRIGGLFYCSHGKFENPGGIALAADDSAVYGNTIMSTGFFADGEVSLRRARLQRILYCTHGNFKNPGGNALSADGAEFGGRAYLGEWFNAKGTVRLANAKIAGDLDCVGGIFQTPRGDAIFADGIRVEGSVRMHTRFLAQGSVRIADATIGGLLNCRDGRFENPGRVALSAERTTIGRDVLLSCGFRALGTVQLSDAKISGALDTEGEMPDGLDIEGVAIGCR